MPNVHILSIGVLDGGGGGGGCSLRSPPPPPIKSQCKSYCKNRAKFGHNSGIIRATLFVLTDVRICCRNFSSLHVRTICRYWNRRCNILGARKKSVRFPPPPLVQARIRAWILGFLQNMPTNVPPPPHET